jgi:spore coat protein H
VAALHQCALDLGRHPWDRLAVGRVAGTLVWDGEPPLAVSVKIRGAHSRRFAKKSVQVDFPREPFADGPPEGHTVRRLHMNADYVDPTLMRTALSYSLFTAFEAPAPLCRHTELTVSGDYAGLYLALESVDRHFLRRRGWHAGPIYYALNRNANFGLLSPFSHELKQPLDSGYKPIHKADTAPLRQLITDLNIASDRSFPAAAERWLDVRGYLTWLMLAVFVGNRDGFVHNYALYQDPESRRFRIIPWDYDATWGIDINGRPARVDRVPLTGWNKLTYRLMSTPRFRELYKELFLEALAGSLSSTALHERIDKLAAEVAPYIDKDQQRHGRNSAFETAVSRLKRWMEKRRALLVQELERL